MGLKYEIIGIGRSSSETKLSIFICTDFMVEKVRIKEQTFHLHHLKAAFWEEESSLLITDLHLGKAAHFRKAGIAVPSMVADANWDRLLNLLLEFKPKKSTIIR